jgi:hypothetical protein
VAAVLAAGCAPGGPVVRGPDTTAIATGHPPQIVEVAKLCDVDDGVWTFVAATDAWTDGGWVYLTTDGRYIEKFRVPSIAAARDGSGDIIRLDLPIAVDWRDDEGTAFACGSAPAGRFQILDVDGATSDCRYWGDPALFDQDFDCPEPL